MFPTKNFKTIKGKQILSDLFIGRPLKMNIVDNKLLMIDKYEGKQITMIDLINTIPIKSNVLLILEKGQMNFLI